MDGASKTLIGVLVDSSHPSGTRFLVAVSQSVNLPRLLDLAWLTVDGRIELTVSSRHSYVEVTQETLAIFLVCCIFGRVTHL